ncbi:MAG: hypothetical protein QOC92_4789, partial [Acidimicrobiaceae bacterium]
RGTRARLAVVIREVTDHLAILERVGDVLDVHGSRR